MDELFYVVVCSDDGMKLTDYSNKTDAWEGFERAIGSEGNVYLFNNLTMIAYMLNGTDATAANSTSETATERTGGPR